MRKLILQRILVIKEREQGFTKSTMRWANFEVTNLAEINTKMVHISEMPFENEKLMEAMSDDRLVLIFERIVITTSKQM